MTHFKNIKSLEDLKNQFKTLAKNNHPDAGGDPEVMKVINAEYDQLFPVWKHRYNLTEPQNKTTETANSTRNEFYTSNGWKGRKYESGQSLKEIAANIRAYIKEIYPIYKFSVTTEYYSGGCSLHVSLMEAPKNIFEMGNETDHYQLNYFYLQDDNRLNELGKAVMIDINNQIKAYHYSDCDSMIDYFNVNFYYNLNIGKWDRPFKIVEKTNRIKSKLNAVATSETNRSEEYEIKEDTHTKTRAKIWVVKIIRSLSRDEYLQEAAKMKEAGGYYSKFKHGFIFLYNPAESLREGKTT